MKLTGGLPWPETDKLAISLTQEVSDANIFKSFSLSYEHEAEDSRSAINLEPPPLTPMSTYSSSELTLAAGTLPTSEATLVTGTSSTSEAALAAGTSTTSEATLPAGNPMGSDLPLAVGTTSNGHQFACKQRFLLL